jgi:hypothetical protein
MSFAASRTSRILIPSLAFSGAALAGLGVAWRSEPVHAGQSSLTTVVLEGGKPKTITGDLSSGKIIDLAWATQSSVACFPATRNEHFNGNHVFYTTELPPRSILKIKATPTASDVDLSLYAYLNGAGSKILPPDVHSVVSCEASSGSKNIKAPFNPGVAENVSVNATTNPYTVIVGVAGAQGTKAGAYSLTFDLTTSAPAPSGVITEATPIATVANETVSVSGKIDGGVEIDLAWATKSSVACFPATKNDHFNGKQVVYSFDLPKYTNATIELFPQDPNLDLNLYAYEVGAKAVVLPPNISSVVSCEASYGTKNINVPYNPGGSEKVLMTALNNPYRVYVGVAGAQKVGKGSFDLRVTLKGR